MRYDPDARLRHTLVVAEDWQQDEALYVEHDRLCPIVQNVGRDPQGRPVSWRTEYDCAVAFEIFNASLESFFCHRDAPLAEPDAVTLAPGRYPIEAWCHRLPADAESIQEWDGGLRVADAAAASVGQDGALQSEGAT